MKLYEQNWYDLDDFFRVGCCSMLNSNNFSSMQFLIAYPWDIKIVINTKVGAFLFLLSCATKMQFECGEITQLMRWYINSGTSKIAIILFKGR